MSSKSTPPGENGVLLLDSNKTIDTITSIETAKFKQATLMPSVEAVYITTTVLTARHAPLALDSNNRLRRMGTLDIATQSAVPSSFGSRNDFAELADAVDTRVVLGPLTTTFTAPELCSMVFFTESFGDSLSQGVLSQTCDYSNAQATFEPSVGCWPPVASGTNSSAFVSNRGWLGVYSPGLHCPAGHSTACSSTAGVTGDFFFDFDVQESETAVGCCPTGYGCVRDDVQTADYSSQGCVYTLTTPGSILASDCGSAQSAGSSYFAPLFTTFTQADDTAEAAAAVRAIATGTVVQTERIKRASISPVSPLLPSPLSTIASIPSSAGVAASTVTESIERERAVSAPMIQLVFQASDLPSSSSTKHGLSTDAIIGIGVGIGVVCLAAITGAGWWYWIRKRRQRRTNERGPINAVQESGDGEGYKKAELDAGLDAVAPVELGGEAARRMHELHDQDRPGELASLGPFHELE